MDWQRITYALPGIIIGLTIHEYCHAFCAWKLGDNTAAEQGRLSLNPVKHIDLIGLLFIIFAGFGWAKPVQFSPENLKNLRRDKALIAAAGPLSNLILGVLFVLIIKAFVFYHRNSYIEVTGFYEQLFIVIYTAASINFGLFIFNLLPIPPLDGSHIVFSGLNIDPETEGKIRKFGLPVLFLILIIQNSTNVTIIPIGKMVQALIGFLLNL